MLRISYNLQSINSNEIIILTMCINCIYLITVNVLEFQTLWAILFLPSLFFYAFVHKIFGANTSSVDPDETAPDLGLHCLHMPFYQTNWGALVAQSDAF